MSTPAQPLPSLETMIAICSEVRDDLREQIRRDPDFCNDRWLQDREPCLYAIDAHGDRLNDGGWLAWRRRKSDVERLLADYPSAVRIIVDSGVNVAANKADHEAGNYVPMFWQAEIWNRDQPVYSDAQLEEIIRRRTGFSSFDDMFKAKGSYRPSIDVRDPEMKAVGDRYDVLAHNRGDDRRAYRYGESKPTPAVVQASQLKAGDVVLIGTVEEPNAKKERTVQKAATVFGLNAMLRFTDGTERALRDDQEVALVNRVAAEPEEDRETPRP